MRPILAGDREILRKLRAAEMAGWEAARPRTTAEQLEVQQEGEKLWRLPAKDALRGEALSFLILSLCAAVILFVCAGDLSELLNGWSQFIEGIGKLLS
jgi:hypothetical protein